MRHSRLLRAFHVTTAMARTLWRLILLRAVSLSTLASGAIDSHALDGFHQRSS
jgi:hypothetical protein